MERDRKSLRGWRFPSGKRFRSVDGVLADRSLPIFIILGLVIGVPVFWYLLTPGTLVVRVVDSSYGPEVNHVYLTVTRIEAYRPTMGTWQVLLATPKTLDLTQLTSGGLVLNSVPANSGRFTQLRLSISEARAVIGGRDVPLQLTEGDSFTVPIKPQGINVINALQSTVTVKVRIDDTALRQAKLSVSFDASAAAP